MKLTKDEFFSKLENGEIDNFSINGVRYYSDIEKLDYKSILKNILIEMVKCIQTNKSTKKLKFIKVKDSEINKQKLVYQNLSKINHDARNSILLKSDIFKELKQIKPNYIENSPFYKTKYGIDFHFSIMSEGEEEEFAIQLTPKCDDMGIYKLEVGLSQGDSVYDIKLGDIYFKDSEYLHLFVYCSSSFNEEFNSF